MKVLIMIPLLRHADLAQVSATMNVEAKAFL